MNAIIISIGDELVLGQTVDTNSAWLSRQLAQVGCGVLAHVTVGDDQPAIERAIADAAGRCQVLIISGGLGPTADDLTRQALAAVMKAPLEMNQEWLRELEGFFRARNRPMPDINRIQAMIPRGAQMIFNTCGTAAGIRATLVGGCQVFVVPGVPKEMMAMFQRDVRPHLSGDGGVILSRTLHTFGLGESAIAQMLGGLMERTRNPSVGTTVSGGIVSLRVNARFESVQRAGQELEKTVQACRAALGRLIYGEEEETLPQIIAGLLKAMPARTVATAESCTGGLLAKMLTDVAGSSQYFKYGWVTYANQAKIDLLGVAAEVLAEHGAVSEAVVAAMAEGARQRAGADLALAISGIAGPEGGTPSKPVGTVCIALAHAGGVAARTFNLFGDREMIRDRASKMALTMLRYHLLGEGMPF